MLICNLCNADNEDSRRFCKSCGSKLVVAGPASVPTPGAISVAEFEATQLITPQMRAQAAAPAAPAASTVPAAPVAPQDQATVILTPQQLAGHAQAPAASSPQRPNFNTPKNAEAAGFNFKAAQSSGGSVMDDLAALSAPSPAPLSRPAADPNDPLAALDQMLGEKNAAPARPEIAAAPRPAPAPSKAPTLARNASDRDDVAPESSPKKGAPMALIGAGLAGVLALAGGGYWYVAQGAAAPAAQAVPDPQIAVPPAVSQQAAPPAPEPGVAASAAVLSASVPQATSAALPAPPAPAPVPTPAPEPVMSTATVPIAATAAAAAAAAGANSGASAPPAIAKPKRERPVRAPAPAAVFTPQPAAAPVQAPPPPPPPPPPPSIPAYTPPLQQPPQPKPRPSPAPSIKDVYGPG